MLRKYQFVVTCAGSNGSATGEGSIGVGVQGWLEAVHVEYSSTTPSSTDVVLSVVDAPVNTLLTLTNKNTTGWFFPRVQVHDTSGSAISAEYDRLPVAGNIKAAVAGNNADMTVTVTLLVEV